MTVSSGAGVCTQEMPPPLTVFRLAGPLNLTTAADLRMVIGKALAEQPSALVLDLAEVDLVDDLMVTVFAALARTAAGWPGCPMLLCTPEPVHHQVLHRMGINRALNLFTDRAQAIAVARQHPPLHRYRWRLASAPGSSAAARARVTEVCQDWQLTALIDDAHLIVTELISNGVRHAGGDLELAIAVRERFLHLSVGDGSPQLPRRSLPDPVSREGGRGLLLLDGIATAWGSMSTGAGKVVWATLRIPPTGRRHQL